MYSLSIGDIFHARYAILAELGKGGMGEVYRAKQLDVNREVALKLLAFGRISDPNDLERFLREFKILSRLSHPNIMAFYNMSITEAGVPYAVCEFIDGKSLRSTVALEGKFSWQRTVKIGIQICAAMQFAHELGVVHRDLKPDNVMLQSTPEPDFVKLIDFGLARTVGEACANSQKLTFTGQLIGSVHYMSPEQCTGGSVDMRSDIYSLGCLIFEIMSGEKLFDAESPIGILQQHSLSDPEERLQTLAGSMPQSLYRILLKTLQKAPEQRYASMKELNQELEALLADKESHIIAAPAKQNLGLRIVCRKYLWLGIPVLLSAIIFGGSLLRQKYLPPERKVLVNKGESRSRLLPRTGMAAHKAIEALIDSRGREDEAEELATSWLAKNEKSANVDQVAVAAILHDLYKIGDRKDHRFNRFENRNHLIERGKLLLAKIQTSGPNGNAIFFKSQLLNDLAYWYFRGNSPEDKKEAREFYRAEWHLFEDADLGFQVWDAPLGLAEKLLECGLYPEAKAFLQRYFKHLNTVNRLYELQDQNGLDYYMYCGEVACLLDQPEQALSSYEHAHKVLLGWFGDGEAVSDRQKHVGARESQFILMQGAGSSRLSNESFVEKLVDLTEKANCLSEPLCAEWLPETIKRFSVENPGPKNWGRWSKFEQMAAECNLDSVALVCADKAISSYLRFKSASQVHDGQLFSLRIAMSECLMRLSKTSESLELLRQTCEAFKSDTTDAESCLAMFKAKLATGCLNKALASLLRKEALSIVDKLEQSVDSPAKKWAVVYRMAWTLDALNGYRPGKRSELLCAAAIQDLKNNAAKQDRVNGIYDFAGLFLLEGKVKEAETLLNCLEHSDFKNRKEFELYKANWFIAFGKELERVHKYGESIAACQKALDLNAFSRAQILDCKLEMIKCRRLGAKGAV